MPPQPNESFTPTTSALKCPWYQPLCKVTPLSKYLAMVIFIAMPFVGGYIGYKLAPEKVVEVPVLDTNQSTTSPTLKVEESSSSTERESAQLAGEAVQRAIDRATTTFVLPQQKDVLCSIALPTHVYKKGETFIGFTLLQHTQSCMYDSVFDNFTFSGELTIRGEISRDNRYEAVTFMSVTDPAYLSKLPSKDNGVTEINSTIYRYFSAPEFESLISDVEKNPSKKYLVEVTLSGMIVSNSAKGPSVRATLKGEPRVIETVIASTTSN